MLAFLYSPGGASVHSHSIHASFGPPESKSQRASQSVHPFLHRESLYFTTGRPLSPKNCPFPWKTDLDRHLIRGSFDFSESSSQTASRSVQPFLQGSLLCQTDRQIDGPTDNDTQSVTSGRNVVLRCGLILMMMWMMMMIIM